MRLCAKTLCVMAVACAAMLPGAAGAVCPLDTFGAQKIDICRSEKCSYFTPPAEIAAIARGAYSEMIGLFINDGLAEWIGVDLDKNEIVQVQRYAGRQLGAAPRASGKNITRRETREGDRRWIDVTRRTPLASDAAGDIVCSANTVWAEPPGPPRVSITDMHQGVVLVDRGTRKVVGGPGGMSDTARVLHAQLERLTGRAPPAIVPIPSGR